MVAKGKNKYNEIIYRFSYKYKGKIIEGSYTAKKGVIRIGNAWVKNK